MPESALQFDGQNYASLGTLGNLGSNMGGGIYCKFEIQTLSALAGWFGSFNPANSNFYIGLNVNYNEAASNADLVVIFEGHNNQFFIGGTKNNTTISFNDGKVHTIEITMNPTTSKVTISIDGTPQTVTVPRADGGYTFNNFTQNWLLGARTVNGVVSNAFACNIDNFIIGTSLSALYGQYFANNDQGLVLTDMSGKGNNGSLQKGTSKNYPLWIPALDADFQTPNNTPFQTANNTQWQNPNNTLFENSPNAQNSWYSNNNTAL